MGAIIAFLVFIYIVFQVIDAFKGLGNDGGIVLGTVVLVMAIPVFGFIVWKRLIVTWNQRRKFRKLVRTIVAEPLDSELVDDMISDATVTHQWQIACLKDLKTIREAIVGALSSEVGEVAETWMALLGECHERIRQSGSLINESSQEKIANLIQETEAKFYVQVTLNVASRHLTNAGNVKRKEAKRECLSQAKEALTEGLAEQTNGNKEVKHLLREVTKQQKALGLQTV